MQRPLQLPTLPKTKTRARQSTGHSTTQALRVTSQTTTIPRVWSSMGSIQSPKYFEADLFKETYVISDMMAPFLNVITQILFVRAWPPATDFTTSLLINPSFMRNSVCGQGCDIESLPKRALHSTPLLRRDRQWSARLSKFDRVHEPKN